MPLRAVSSAIRSEEAGQEASGRLLVARQGYRSRINRDRLPGKVGW